MMSGPPTSRTNGAKHTVSEVLAAFADAILLASPDVKPGRLQGRSMHVANVDQDGTLWFMSEPEITERDALVGTEAYVVFQSTTRQVFLRGLMALVTEPSEIEARWDARAEAAFPGGATSGKACLVRFSTVEGELWDHRGVKSVRYFLDIPRAVFCQERACAGDQDEVASVRTY
ncbi:MAG: pyridoxamine 5'-phosphate oxidase family protein [Polyangiaceae bacterium]|nr:pyridoxamine 5'-phosphate oxidase family protein [Polyangiaceae bacterium]